MSIRLYVQTGVNFSAQRLYTDFSIQISFTNFSAQRFYSSSSWANSSGADLVLGLRLVRARASSIILAMRRSGGCGVLQLKMVSNWWRGCDGVMEWQPPVERGDL